MVLLVIIFRPKNKGVKRNNRNINRHGGKEIKNREHNNIINEINGNKNLLDNSIDATLDELLNKYYKLNSDKEILESDINKLKIDKNDILANISEIEINNKKIISNYNKLINYDLDIDIKSSNSKLNTIKKELSLLPNINLGSIEEFDRINERFEFLTNQKLDLVESINNLLEVINELDETMKEKFIDTFNKVNIEFNKVFKKLFKGGIGELHLTDPDDLLNTGVDITACPPGKTLKSINLLSGGEKTLTAIALLFAILNIRYVPFCILDEVEAALDEANVDMFGNYIKEYENKTEFIIITHKKRTMEYANTLYGITMQESGISKLVSVKLDDIK